MLKSHWRMYIAWCKDAARVTRLRWYWSSFAEDRAARPPLHGLFKRQLGQSPGSLSNVFSVLRCPNRHVHYKRVSVEPTWHRIKTTYRVRYDRLLMGKGERKKEREREGGRSSVTWHICSGYSIKKKSSPWWKNSFFIFWFVIFNFYHFSWLI